MSSQDIENEIAALQAALEAESSPLRQLDISYKLQTCKEDLQWQLKYEAKQRLLQEKQKQTKLL